MGTGTTAGFGLPHSTQLPKSGLPVLPSLPAAHRGLAEFDPFKSIEQKGIDRIPDINGFERGFNEGLK